MIAARILFSTIDNKEKAKTIAKALVQEHLAACVSIIADVVSVYKWKEQLEESTEQLLMIKTSVERVHQAIDRIKELHSYELPEIIEVSIEGGYPPYLDWIVENVVE